MDLDGLMRATEDGSQYDVLWKQKRRMDARNHISVEGSGFGHTGNLGLLELRVPFQL